MAGSVAKVGCGLVVGALLCGCVSRVRQMYDGGQRSLEETAYLALESLTPGAYDLRLVGIDGAEIPFWRTHSFAGVLPGTHEVTVLLPGKGEVRVEGDLGGGLRLRGESVGSSHLRCTYTQDFRANEIYYWMGGQAPRTEDYFLWLASANDQGTKTAIRLRHLRRRDPGSAVVQTYWDARVASVDWSIVDRRTVRRRCGYASVHLPKEVRDRQK